MNLPNKLTVLRMILMPVMVVLFYLQWFIPCAVVFILASLTDMLDGKIARKRGLVTVFGKFFDPLADKMINLAAIVLLAARISVTGAPWYGILMTVTAVVVITRELLITSLRALAANEGVVIAADKMGKMKTVMQDIAIVLLFVDEAGILGESFIGIILHWTAVAVLLAALVLTVLSGINYFVSNGAIMEKIGKDI